ncbi:portal protein [Sphingomonas oryzagri]|uniref:Portal protein n=1 Tax=Sphingomonas oryzagri TaxID=3042314 RepID=A0ABT6N0X0_9SPHN|nr:portal protein [Sphingomonas oryzagri]MDH7638948.1 portal protein [Sphingomonas oryzagri]
MADDFEPVAESDIDNTKEAANNQRMMELHDEAMQRFDSVARPQQELRAQSLEARRFVTIPGAQWEGAWGEQFENAPRPEVDKITKSLEKIETDYRENRLTVDFVPGQGADVDSADLLDGMHRADSHFFKAQQARDNAFQEAIRGGFGAYRLTTDYADPYDPDDDSQRVNPGLTIVDADQSVYFDGGSILYDASDAKWAFIITASPRAEAEAKWGANNLDPWPLANWKYAWDWYTPDIVRTAEYYVVEESTDKLLIFTQKDSGEEQRYFETDLDEESRGNLTAQGWEVTERPIKRKRVHKYILNGMKVLRDCGYIAGDQIPIVPVYGKRDYVDNMPRWRGHVGKMMDRQRIYNTRIAKLVETDSLAPREVPIIAIEQIAGTINDGLGGVRPLAEVWARQNIDRLPFLPIMPLRQDDGTIVSAGPLGKVEPPQVQPVTAALLQIASGDLTDEDDNADQVKANTSAEAMDLAAARVDAKSGIYLDNMRQSIAREGEIYLGMARAVYFEPGRKVETLTLDGQDGEATLQETVLDKGLYKVRNDLSRGKFKVIADVQESTATKRQKTVKQNMEIAAVAVQAQDMQLAQAATLTAVLNQDGEGQQDMQQYARSRLIALGVVKPTPEEAQELQQAAQQQQPDPQAIALQAAAQESQSKSALNMASAQQKQADAQLKQAQAEELSKAPAVPTGLSTPANDADIADKYAGAQLKAAQAEHLQHDMHQQRIKTGAQLHQDAHDREMQRRQQDLAERQQDHAERQPQGDAA